MTEQLNLLEKHFDIALESPDGIKKLRELILTLAMQGKLVKQDPNDQQASELLKEIRAEKARLIKEGTIKKQKELPQIKPEEVPYEVPEGWVWTRLGEIAELIGGFAYDSKEFKYFGDKQVLRLGNIRPDTIRLYENPVFIDEKKAKETSAFKLHIDDIIITMTGTRAKRDYLYTVRVLENPMNGKTLFLNQRVGVIRLFFDSTFLNKALKNETLKDIIYQTSTGSANQANIGMLALKKWTVPLPPLSEQKRIVTKINELMDLCDKLEVQRKVRNDKRLAVHTAAIKRLLTAVDKKEFDASWKFVSRHFDPLYSVKKNVAELKKAILTLAMQGKLVKQNPNDQPASELLKEIQAEKARLIKEGKIKKQKELPQIKPEEVPYEVPKGWAWARLGEISSYIQRGKGPKYADVSEHRVISQKCVRWYGIDIEPARFIEDSSIDNYENIRFLKVNDLLWNSTGTGTIGRACLFPSDLAEKKWVVDSHVTVVRCVSIESSFLWRFIQSPIVQNEIEN